MSRVKQPGLPTVVWQVSAVRDGESFAWEAHSPGVHTVAFHELRGNPDGGTRITIGIEQTGLLSGLVGALLAGKTRRYLSLEAAGLKAASETGPASESGAASGGA